MTQNYLLEDVHARLVDEGDRRAIFRTQHIPDSFLSEIADERLASAGNHGEMQRVARIPVAIVEKWLGEGFDVYRESVPAIMARLRAEDMGRLISTSKQV
ncbi:hypothetical protein [Pyruvatibacter mobilis]|uniref:hypothetical protein n=1 Tax=Pyruvatibacter mobilis TaxID=1712261 RepID=UPI003BAA65E5